MTKRRDDATARLAALLDRLAAELLDAPDSEAKAALHETGRARAAALQEVRVLLTPGTRADAAGKASPIAGAASSVAPARRPTHRH